MRPADGGGPAGPGAPARAAAFRGRAAAVPEWRTCVGSPSPRARGPPPRPDRRARADGSVPGAL